MNVKYCLLLLLLTSVVSTVVGNEVEGRSDDVLWIRDSLKQFIMLPQV